MESSDRGRVHTSNFLTSREVVENILSTTSLPSEAGAFRGPPVQFGPCVGDVSGFTWAQVGVQMPLSSLLLGPISALDT